MKLKFRINWLRVFNFILIGIVIIINSKLALWKEKDKVIEWDIISYYAYLPATFIHGDLSLDFKSTPNELYWPLISPTGKKVIKTTMGLSILYSPFFLIAHAITPLTKYTADGFTQPYKLLLILSSIIYLSLGLYFLRKFLQNYCKDLLIAITFTSIVLGTNLLLYSTLFANLSHSYNFFLFSAFIYFTSKWHLNTNIKYSIIIGVLAGLIALIRPTNIIIILFFLLYGITTAKELKVRLILLLTKYKLILLMIFFSSIIWLPQIIYWKIQTGQYFYFSYQNERFFFSTPNILNSLFSYRNGWLLYTPLMIFSLIGIFILLKKNNRSFFIPVLIFTIFNIYIISSWWCWWYTGFSNRAYIDSYAILSIPFIFLLKEIKNWNKIIFVFICFIIFSLIGFNLFQSRQYYNGAIHYDSMTKESYFESFGHLNPSQKFYESLQSPNHYNARIGISENIYNKNIYFCGAEKLDSSKNNFQSEYNNNITFINSLNRSTEKHFKGNYSVKLDQTDPYGFNYIFNNLKYEDKLNITVWVLDKYDYPEVGIVCTSITPGVFSSFGNKVIKKLPNGWKKIQLKVTLPYFENEVIKVYTINPRPNPVYFDNILIERNSVLTNLKKY